MLADNGNGGQDGSVRSSMRPDRPNQPAERVVTGGFATGILLRATVLLLQGALCKPFPNRGILLFSLPNANR